MCTYTWEEPQDKHKSFYNYPCIRIINDVSIPQPSDKTIYYLHVGINKSLIIVHRQIPDNEKH